MHLSIGLHTSAGKSYPQPLQPAKHRGIALDINQRLRTDRPNYLSKARSRGSFFCPFEGKNIHLPKVENIAPIHQLLKSPKRQLISGVKSPPFSHQINKLFHSIIPTTSTDQKSDHYWSASEPVLLTLSYQYYSPYRTSTAHTSDQYWSTRRPVLVNSPTTTGRIYLSIEAKLRALIAAPLPPVYIRHALHWIGRSQRGAYTVRKGRKRGRNLLRGELKSSLRRPRRRREVLGRASLRPAHAGAPAARVHASRER